MTNRLLSNTQQTETLQRLAAYYTKLAKTESAKQRISDLDKLFSRIYEDNILGKLSDERYSRMANEYEAEQKRLISEVKENEKVLIELQKQTVDMKMLYQFKSLTYHYFYFLTSSKYCIL